MTKAKTYLTIKEVPSPTQTIPNKIPIIQAHMAKNIEYN